MSYGDRSGGGLCRFVVVGGLSAMDDCLVSRVSAAVKRNVAT